MGPRRAVNLRVGLRDRAFELLDVLLELLNRLAFPRAPHEPPHEPPHKQRNDAADGNLGLGGELGVHTGSAVFVRS